MAHDGGRVKVLLAIAGLLGVLYMAKPAPLASCVCPSQVVWNPLWSENPHGIGGRVGDKRRLTREEQIAVLEAQLSDPHRHPLFDDELKREIARLKKTR
jgi:hypothetical protein